MCIPALLNPLGSALLVSHHLFWHRQLLRGSILAEVTSPPSCLMHWAGRWDEVTIKLLREVSINTVLETIRVCGNLFVLVH